MLPSIVTERPPASSRTARVGTHGITLTPTLVATLCSRPAHPLGALTCTSGAPGRLRVMASPSSPLVPLNDGNCIPAVGFGVFKIPPTDTEQAVGTALRAGYRHIDTAAMYRNERETGRAVAESGVPRDELYLVTKLWNADQGYDSTLAAFDASMQRLGIDYLDLYLVHWPVPGAEQVRRHLQGVRPPARPGPDPVHRGQQFRARAHQRLDRRHRDRARRQPGRAASAAAANRAAGGCTPGSASRPRRGVRSGRGRC